LHKDVTAEQNKKVIYHLACWGLMNDGEVVGLISVSHSAMGMPKVPRLVTVPPITDGIYKHKDELTEEEKNTLRNYTNT
jgi:hypothetical protein